MKRALGGITLVAVMIAGAWRTDLLARHTRPPAATSQAQQQSDPASCRGMLRQSAALSGLLSAVPKYQSSYVLIVPQRLAARVPTAAAPGVKQIQIGVHAGTQGADAARAIGITNLREYPLDMSSLGQPLQDVKDTRLDAAILWAPLAGLAIMELGLDGQVSIFTIDKPHDPPAALRAAAAPHPCADAIGDELEVNGALPAELLAPIEFRPLLIRRAPPFNLTQAREGQSLYKQACSKCHGPDAVADPHGLAPVDLRLSVGRFSYPGFLYIMLNGRPDKSMPPLRGTVTEEQISLIYQYLKARTDKLLPAGGQ